MAHLAEVDGISGAMMIPIITIDKSCPAYVGLKNFKEYKDKRLSNGPIEGINSRIKALKKIYCGYSNYKRFYKRVIYIINQKKDTNSSNNNPPA